MSAFKFALVFHGGHYYFNSDDFPGTRYFTNENENKHENRLRAVFERVANVPDVHNYICVCVRVCVW